MAENREHVVASRLNDYEYQQFVRFCSNEHVKHSEGVRMALKRLRILNEESESQN